MICQSRPKTRSKRGARSKRVIDGPPRIARKKFVRDKKNIAPKSSG